MNCVKNQAKKINDTPFYAVAGACLPVGRFFTSNTKTD
jgi:hypothetical protein